MRKKSKMKKTLLWVGGLFVLLIVIALIFGESAEDKSLRLAKEKSINDSIERVQIEKKKFRDSIHNYRMKNDRSYKDSVLNFEKLEKERLAAEEKARIELDKTTNPDKYISVTNSSCEEGGFGAVALATFTLKNESLRDVGDIEMKFTFRGESGTVLRTEQKIVPIVLKKGQSKTVRKENLGFHPQNAATMSTEFVSFKKLMD
jgi:hypothetical protein